MEQEVARDENRLAHFIAPLRDAGCRVSIFIAAEQRQIEAAHRIGAEVIELHTGSYCDAHAEGNFAAGKSAFKHGLVLCTVLGITLFLGVYFSFPFSFSCGLFDPVFAFLCLSLGGFLMMIDNFIFFVFPGKIHDRQSSSSSPQSLLDSEEI